MPAAAYPIAIFLGLAIGSFLNVVAWRLPRGESIVSPPSACPGCGARLKPYDNIPVLSWLLLRGRCRSCKAPISIRYSLVELATAAVYVAICALLWDDTQRLVLGLILATFLIPISAIDLAERRIPNKLTAPAAALALPAGAITGIAFVPEQLIAGAAAMTFFLIPALIAKKGMGMGDVKLAAVMGLYLGAPVAVAIITGLVLGTLVGIVVIFRKGVGAGRKTAVPFGPFLALGSLLAVVAGPELLDVYLGSFG